MQLDGRLFGFFRGCVTEVDITTDELKEYGAIRIFLPDLMTSEDPDYNEEEMGIIAYPANNPFGGRNDMHSETYGVGTVYVPNKGEWVWVFFEQGDKKKPFYWNAVNIKNTKLPPENRVNFDGDQLESPHLVYTIVRTRSGRSFVIADSEDVQRIEITGKKAVTTGKPDASDQNYGSIDGSQTSILFDERPGQEKILIRTHKGDFLHIDIDERKLQAYFKSDMLLKTDGNFHLQAQGEVLIVTKGNIKTKSNNLHITAENKSCIMSMGEMNISSPNMKITGTMGVDVLSGGNIVQQAIGSINNIALVNVDTLAGVNVNVKATGIIASDGQMRMDQSGMAIPPVPPVAQAATPAEKPTPIDPMGERST